MDPLELFPYEIWTHIFEFYHPATDKETIKNCYYANTSFRPLLEARLFAEAFKVLQNHLRETTTKSNQLECVDILNLRLVSKHWRAIIDHFSDNHTGHNDVYESEPSSLPVMNLSLESSYRISEIVQVSRKANNPTYNPFQSHYLRIDFGADLPDSQAVSRFQESLYNFVNLFGHLIWYFECHGNLRGGSLSYKFLYSCISKMTKLKALYIDYKQETKGDLIYDRLDDNSFYNSDFPKLKKLTTLGLSEAHISTICTAVNANPHVKKIVIKQNTPAIFQQTWLIKEQCWDLKSLERLHIESTYALCVYYASYSFRRTVKHLSCVIEDPEVSAPLDLPYLEELSVDIKGKVNLDFMMHLKHVHTLKVKMEEPGSDADDIRRKVDLPDCLDCVEKSNVWLYLSRLRNLEVTFKKSKRPSIIYTRLDNGFITKLY